MYMYQANKRVLWVRTVPGQTQGTADTGPPVPWEIQGTRVTGPPVPCQNPGPTGSGSGRTRSHTLEKRSNLPVRTTLPRRLRPCRTLSTAAISRPATALGLALGGGLLLHHARSAHQAVRCATGWFLLLSGPTLSRSGLIATGLQVRSKQRVPRVPTGP